MPTANPVPAGTLRDRPSFLGSLLRPKLLRLLNNMGDGQLDVTDPDGQWKVGHLKGTDSPKAHLRIGDTSVYPRLLFGGSIAAAETYADRMWSSEASAFSLKKLKPPMRRVRGLDTPDSDSRSV